MVEFVHRGLCVNYHHQYVYEPFFGLDCELCAERVLALNLNLRLMHKDWLLSFNSHIDVDE
jgi:hypothetical protein